MKKRHLIFKTILYFPFFVYGQIKIDVTPEIVNKTMIDIVYNQYFQNGNNSAVTGGIGTEELYVYGPSLNIKRIKNLHSFNINLGADVITSASTDNIDFVVSSASKIDSRVYINGKYEKYFKKLDCTFFGGAGLSIESDYFSLGSKLGIIKESKNRLSQYNLEFQMFNDDLRWGRVSPNYFRPVKLIYPVELRYKEWYDVVKRNTYNLKIGWNRVLNKRNILGLYSDVSFQSGLLATPFHRIYFSDGTEAVEQLPKERWRFAFAFKLNSFIGGRVVVKNAISPYLDNFGVLSLALQNETLLKLNHKLFLLSNIRVFAQKESFYFNKIFAHDKNELYYTSDFDLSTFQTLDLGLGLKLVPDQSNSKKVFFNSLTIRYNFMYNTRGLIGHMVSLAIQTEWKKQKK